LSKPATSYSNLSLIVEAQGLSRHAKFLSDKQIFTQVAKITSPEHHSRWLCGR